MNIIDNFKDRWVTHLTGRNRQQREYDTWQESNVNKRASTIEEMFKNFQYIIEVDTYKFLDHSEPFAWIPNKDARQYFWPARPLGENCIWCFKRVYWDRWLRKWAINDLIGEDRVFVATNSGADATMITLRWA